MTFSKYTCVCPNVFFNSSSPVLDRLRANLKLACEGFKISLKRLKKLAISALSNLKIELSLDSGLKRRLTGADFSYELLQRIQNRSEARQGVPTHLEVRSGGEWSIMRGEMNRHPSCFPFNLLRGRFGVRLGEVAFGCRGKCWHGLRLTVNGLAFSCLRGIMEGQRRLWCVRQLEKREGDHMSATFRRTRTLRFLWNVQAGLRRLQGAHHPDYGLASSLSRPPRAGRLTQRREACLTSSRVLRQGSSPASFRLGTASPRNRRSKGLSRMTGHCHVRF